MSYGASWLGRFSLNQQVDFYFQNKDPDGSYVDTDLPPDWRVYDGLSIVTTGAMQKVDIGVDGFYYGSLTPSTGLGFAFNKNYLIRIDASNIGAAIVDLQQFRTEYTLPHQIFNSIPADYSEEENFAEDILQIQSNITGISNKIGIPETTLAEDISNVPAEAATYVWSAVFNENPGPVSTALDYVVVTYDNTTGIQSKVNNIPAETATSVWSSVFNENPGPVSTALDYVVVGYENITGIDSRQTSIMSGINDLKDYVGVSGENLTGIPYTSGWNTQIQQVVSDTLYDYDPPTKEEVDAAVSNTLKKDVTYSITTSNGTMDVTYGDT